jgi:putative sterol carrier protein
MALYEDTAQAEHVFGTLFQILMQDETFTTRLRASGLTARLIHTKPDCRIFLSPDGLLMGDQVPDESSITVSMSCDTAHSLWMGKLMMPAAVATGRVRIRGKIAKVLEFVPILRPAFDRYPEIAASCGVAS